MPKLLQLSIETATKNEINIYCEETREEVEAKALRALKRGAEVTWNDGSQQWIEPVPVLSVDFSCVFHADGERIRTNVIETTKRDGYITERVLRTVWMGYDKAWGQ